MTHANRALFKSLARIGGVILAIVLVIAGMAWIGSQQDRAKETPTLSTPVSENDWFQGGKDAKVVIVEYSDFQCPACKAYFSVMTGLEQQFGDQIKIVYRHFPLTQIHANAQLAAQAAEAAGLQGQFFAMHDVLFTNQSSWSAENNPEPTFTAYAEALGLDVARFTSDLRSATVRDAVRDDLTSGMRSRVDSTPTFFLNGEIIQSPQGVEPFAALITAKLAEIAAAEASVVPEGSAQESTQDTPSPVTE